MKKIKLNDKEFAYITSLKFMPIDFFEIINRSIKHRNIIEMTEENADKFRDFFGERLQLVGFDENYELTEEGEILENLIDDFFCG